jgi:hypothetical protein
VKGAVLTRRVILALLVSALAPAAERVVAVGDLHGAYEQFVSLLREAGVVDKDLNWKGGKTILVQTGDVLDRGPRSRDALDLLMALVDKAKAQGGEVRPLLGNHETMVMIGDLRYVAPEEFQAFATPDSEKIRDKEYDTYMKYRRQRSSKTRQPAPSGDDAKRAWMEAHPLGFIEFRQAFSPLGKYGKWLRMQDAVTQVDDTIFLHGGLGPGLKFKSLQEINQQVRKDLETYDKAWTKLAQRGVIWGYQTLDEAQEEAKLELRAQQSGGGNLDPELITFLSLGNLVFASPTGPLWYRGYAQESEAELGPKLDQVLKQYKAKHMVLGHTIPAAKRITPRFDGKVMLIDTGMLPRAFQGRASALEIAGGEFKTIYVGEPAQPINANGK